MSLEAKIELLTAAVERLTAVMQSGTAAAAPVSAVAAIAAAGAAATVENAAAVTATKTTRAKKETPAPTSAPAPAAAATTGSPAAQSTEVRPSIALGAANDGKTPSSGLQQGDPEGTLYFHVAAHNTVAAIKPGEVVPNMAGMVEVNGYVYTELKAKYAAALVPSQQGAANGGAAATPAAATPSASPASATTSDASDSGKTLMEKCKTLHARDGNDALRKVIDKFGVARVGELVAQTAKHTEALAFVESLLNPVAADAASMF